MYDFLETDNSELGDRLYLTYHLSDEDKIDTVEAEMLKNNKIKGVLPFSKSQSNDDISFLYDVTNMISLQKFWGGIARWEDIVSVFSHIVNTLIECEYYMLSREHFVFHTALIFIDVETRVPQLLFAPMENSEKNRVRWNDFFGMVLSNISYDTRDNRDDLAYLRAVLTEPTLSLKDFLEKMIHREEKAVKSDEIMEDVKNDRYSYAQDNFVPNREVEKKARENLVLNVPDQKSERMVQSDYDDFSSSKNERKTGIHLFRKKDKKSKTDLSKSNSSGNFMGIEIPGSEIGGNVSGYKKMSKESGQSKVESVGETVLSDSNIQDFKPCLIARRTKNRIMIDKMEFKIGRDPAIADYTPTEPTVGRFHATIVLDYDHAKAYVRDNNSKNKTFVDGRAIQSNINHLLEDGVQVCFGKDEYIYRVQ